MKTAAILARVSTEDQRKGKSLETQAETCLRFAKNNGFDVPADYVLLEDVSGTIQVKDRPIQSYVYVLMEQGKIDSVIVHSIDRLDRGTDEGFPTFFWIFLSDCAELGIDVYNAEDGQRLDGEWLTIAKVKVAAQEKKSLLERSMRNKQAWFRSGKVYHGGQIPFGYVKVGKMREAELAIDETESAIVRQVFSWYLDDGLTFSEIKKRLDSTDVRPKRGQLEWSLSSIAYMIKQDIYAGVFSRKVVPPGQTGKQTRAAEKRGITYPIETVSKPELAIISIETIEAAKAKAQRNLEMSKRASKTDYLLSGFLFCGECESRIHGTYAKRTDGCKYRYYAHRQGANQPKQPCDLCKRAIPADVAEDLVWTWLVNLLSSPEQLLQSALSAEARRQAEIEPKKKELVTVKKKFADLEQETAGLVKQLGRADDKIADMIWHRIEECQEAQLACQKRAQELEAEIEQHQSLLGSFKIPDGLRIVDSISGFGPTVLDDGEVIGEPGSYSSMIHFEYDDDDPEVGKTLTKISTEIGKLARAVYSYDFDQKRRLFEKISLRVDSVICEDDCRALRVSCDLSPETLLCLDSNKCKRAPRSPPAQAQPAGFAPGPPPVRVG